MINAPPWWRIAIGMATWVSRVIIPSVNCRMTMAARAWIGQLRAPRFLAWNQKAIRMMVVVMASQRWVNWTPAWFSKKLMK